MRFFAGYDPSDPRPPLARALDTVRECAASYASVGLELSLGTQASDRMVGEPTTFTRDWFDAFGEAEDATPLLAEARAIKTEQEIERMRLANAIAAAAMEHCKLIIEPGMTEAQVAAEWLGFVHGEGTGWEGKVELALGFSLVWSGPGIRTFTATTSRPVVEGEPTLFEIWVCADGYWCDHTKNLVVGELTANTKSSRKGSRLSTTTQSTSRDPARAWPSSTAASAPGSKRSDSRPAVAPDLPRRRRPRPRAAVRAPGRRRRDPRRHGACNRARML